jgi:hypothetical protein
MRRLEREDDITISIKLLKVEKETAEALQGDKIKPNKFKLLREK